MTDSKAPGAWWRRHARFLDAVVAGGLFLYGLPLLPVTAEITVTLVLGGVLSFAMAAVHLARRQRPLTVFLALLALAGLHTLAGYAVLPTDVLLFIGVYTLATTTRLTASLGSALALMAWVAVALGTRREELWLGPAQIIQILLLVLVVWFAGRLVGTRRQYVASLQERARQLEREQEAQARIAAEEERNRIAREMHDVVAHGLTAMIVLSDAAAQTVDAAPREAQAAMRKVRDTGRAALADMRRTLRVLRDDAPALSPQPGIDRLPALVADARDWGLPVHLSTHGGTTDLPADLGLAVYRLVQESLTNVRRHAGDRLTRVDVTLDRRPGELAVTVTDDGQGAAAPDGGGHGVTGMRERVTALGGRFTAGPTPDGFRVSATLPLEVDDDDPRHARR